MLTLTAVLGVLGVRSEVEKQNEKVQIDGLLVMIGFQI